MIVESRNSFKRGIRKPKELIKVTARERKSIWTKLVLTTSILLLIAAAPFSPVQAQLIGLVCLAPASATACPSPPVTVSSPVGSQLTVPVLVMGSDAFSGFDITLETNHTILAPAGFSISGSLLAGGSIVLECIGAVLKAGSRCASTDTVDSLHLALVGPPGFLTTAPSTGLLFTAIFNVTRTANTAVGYQTGCNPSSVNGTSTCVLFANGGLIGPAEVVQAATYTQAPSPTISLASSRPEITMAKGETANSTITIMSINGFTGTVTISTGFTPSTQHPPSLSISPSTAFLAAEGQSTVLFVISTKSNTSRTSYNVAITTAGSGVSGSIQIPITIIV